MKERIYVCHTYYHVYIAFLKEFSRGETNKGKACVVLSSISTDFEQLRERMEATGFWEAVIPFDEKADTFFPELAPLKQNQGNLIKNLWNRMRFTKELAKYTQAYVPVDFKQYKDIFVFCDSDPIGYYLNYKKIKYHAMEDGLDCLAIFDAARFDNRGHFGLKAFLASLNLIFIQNGYSKYCIDMEINDKAKLKFDCSKYKVLPRKDLEKTVTSEQKKILLRSFLYNADEIIAQLKEGEADKENVLLLTEQLCSLPVRKQIFTDIINEFAKGKRVFIKPHPRDEMDYEKEFPEHIVLKGRFPLEILNHIEGIHFQRAIAVFTQAIYAMEFVDEKIFLGETFMDKYEDPEIHRYNDKL